MTRPVRLKWLRVSSLWVYRAVTWSVLVTGLTFAGVVLALRYWVLPNVEHYREDIARIVSEKAGQQITIGRISANWDGLRPQLLLEQVTVHDAAGRPALELSRVDNTLSWFSLPTMQLRFHALDIYSPTLNIRRDPKGKLSVAGIELTGQQDGGGFADWLLQQRNIEIHDATIVWHDEMRRAPKLELKSVQLQIVNRGGRHQFGLRAEPPARLAGPLDVRGELSGTTVKALADWNGRLYLELDYADFAAWRTWVPYPIEFPRGTGGVRTWLTFSQDRLTDAIADVRLANVRARLEKNLPELDVSELSGRLGWKMSASSFEVTTSTLKLITTGGLALPPTDFLLRVTNAAGTRPGRGEFKVNALDLAPLVVLADHLPFPVEVREQLATLSPKGQIQDVQVRWTGDWREPTEYSAKARFTGLALNGMGKIPGFKGVSGNLEGSEHTGTLQLHSQGAVVEMPLVFREPLQFDVLTAQVAWTRSDGETDLRLNNISFSNSHLAGTVFGNYRTAGDSRGNLDLTGNLTRADARHASRYIPLAISQRVRDWIDVAFLSGVSNDVSLRLKGNLNEFPFPDEKSGVFQVVAKVTEGTLDYAAGWPKIENIAGDLVFRGPRLEVIARQGSVMGARLSNVHAQIPDLLNKEEKMLTVTGEAEGATSEFLAFIEKSPVLGMIDHFTENWQAQGPGKLTLKLDMPLRGTGKTQVAGAYQFTGNTVLGDPDFPPIEQASGQLEFTESTVRAQGITGTFVGGPITLSASTQRDSIVRIVIQGQVNADNVRKSGTVPPWLQSFRGTTDWRATYSVQKRVADLVIESGLQGLAADLPAPLTKAAADTLPFRFERRSLGQNQDRLGIAFGDVVSAQFNRRIEGKRAVISRGTVRFGGAAPEPERNGVWVSGAVKNLDLDRWLALLRDTGGDTRIDWGGLELKAESVDLFGRRFNQLALNAIVQGGLWRGTVAGKELDGNANWDPQGRGKLVARLKTVTIPALVSDTAAAKSAGKSRELPSIDLVAEQFIKNDKQLGRLELNATSTGESWRIEKLRITNPDGAFAAEGLWHTGLTEPRTQISLRLDTPDAGKLLTRLGYPDGMRRGKAKLEGALAWNGAPYDFDYPSLSGGLLLEVQRGQFNKLDPGIGKLLGILSLQALPRRITLDFRDIFSEGLAFDDIVASIKIDRGIASTDSFRTQGPSARIVMSGEVDLTKETQKLRVRVSPSVSDGVSIAGALIGGPIAGVAAFLAQKILKDPLDQMVSYEYMVTGNWVEPVFTRVERTAGADDRP